MWTDDAFLFDGPRHYTAATAYEVLSDGEKRGIYDRYGHVSILSSSSSLACKGTSCDFVHVSKARANWHAAETPRRSTISAFLAAQQDGLKQHAQGGQAGGFHDPFDVFAQFFGALMLSSPTVPRPTDCLWCATDLASF